MITDVRDTRPGGGFFCPVPACAVLLLVWLWAAPALAAGVPEARLVGDLDRVLRSVWTPEGLFVAVAAVGSVLVFQLFAFGLGYRLKALDASVGLAGGGSRRGRSLQAVEGA